VLETRPRPRPRRRRFVEPPEAKEIHSAHRAGLFGHEHAEIGLANQNMGVEPSGPALLVAIAEHPVPARPKRAGDRIARPAGDRLILEAKRDRPSAIDPLEGISRSIDAVRRIRPGHVTSP